MKIEWMGRYRDLLKALVLHSNMTSRISGMPADIAEGISLSPYEWQVFECILEHEDENVNMIYMSNELALPQSTFSKITKKLCKCGIVQRYQVPGNRKNIILRGTDLGRKIYLEHVEQVLKKVFEPFFAELENLPDEAIQTFTSALYAFNKTNHNSDTELIPVIQDNYQSLE